MTKEQYLNFQTLVKSRAYRILRRMHNYYSISDKTVTQFPIDIQLTEQEEMLGAYENVPGNLYETVFFSTNGIWLQWNNTWKCIKYGDIEAIIAPYSSEKTTLSTIRLLLANKEFIHIPIQGFTEREQYRDAWQVQHFLSHIVRDFSKRQLNS